MRRMQPTPPTVDTRRLLVNMPVFGPVSYSVNVSLSPVPALVTTTVICPAHDLVHEVVVD